jgi:hypothetical protein
MCSTVSRVSLAVIGLALLLTGCGDRPGRTYYAAGIRLKYRRGSQEYAVTLYQIGLDCVITASTEVGSACNVSAAANKQIEALPHP